MTLPALQQAFKNAVLGTEDGALTDHIVPGLAARIAVYRNTVQGSLTEVVAAAFPVTRRIVGPAFFAVLAGRYATRRPPRLPQLSAYGADFPDFLANDATHHGLDYLPDVARLEWARGESYFAADAPTLAPETIAALAPQALETAVLAPHPATRLIASRFPIMRIWRVNQPEVADVPAVDMAVAENVLISRTGGHVTLRELAAGDAAFVAAIQEGCGLGAAAARGQEAAHGFDLETALRDHLIGGTFSGVLL